MIVDECAKAGTGSADRDFEPEAVKFPDIKAPQAPSEPMPERDSALF